MTSLLWQFHCGEPQRRAITAHRARVGQNGCRLGLLLALLALLSPMNVRASSGDDASACSALVQQSPTPPRPVARQPSTELFMLREVRIGGNSVLDRATVARIVGPYQNRQVGPDDIEDLRYQLSLWYVRHCYISSGVVVEDVSPAQGIVRVKAIEGHLREPPDITIVPERDNVLSRWLLYNPQFFQTRLAHSATPAFNLSSLREEQLRLLEQPFVSKIDLDVQPGSVPGETVVIGTVMQKPPYALNISVADDQSPTVGGTRGQIGAGIGNLLHVGDVLGVTYGRSAALNDGSISYAVPISSDDTRVTLQYNVSNSAVVSNGLAPLEITGQYANYVMALSRPFIRTSQANLTLGVSFEMRRQLSELLGEPFSFAPGSDNGRTNLTVLREFQNWSYQTSERSLALRSTFSQGFNALGATVTHSKPDGRFFDWLGQAQYGQRILGDWEVWTRASLQLSGSSLFPIEQYVLGGTGSVRGYREYLELADSAFVGSIEVRLPVFIGETSFLEELERPQFVVFYDHGIGWNVRGPSPAIPSISSIGAGLRLSLPGNLTAAVYYGYGLHPAHAGSSLEDHGVHFVVTKSFF